MGTRFVIDRLASGAWLGTLTVGDITVERVEKHLLSVYSHLLGSWWRELHGQETGDRRVDHPQIAQMAADLEMRRE